VSGRPSAGGGRSAWRYAPVMPVVAFCALAAKGLEHAVGLHDPAMVFLAGVLTTAVLWGLGPSVFAAIASMLVYDLFFVDPLFMLTVSKTQDLVSLIVFLAVAVLTSQLAARARDQADAARRREMQTAALYSFTRDIAGAIGLEDLLPTVASRVAEQFATGVAILTAEGSHLVLRVSRPAGLVLPDTELAVATSAWRGARYTTNEWTFAPLHTARGVLGVIGVQTKHLAAEPRELLEAIGGQTAVAIERTRIDVVLEEKAKTEQVIEASEDGIVVLDGEGRVAHVNEVACAIVGLERAVIQGQPFDDLASSHPHYLRLRERVRELVAHPEREGERVEVARFLRGRDHYYVLRATPFRARDGARSGLILVLQDVTYVRDQEERREHLVATLSHELRTPLTSLRMAVELMRRRMAELPADVRELAETAHEDVLRLQDVSQQFLDLARSRATTIALERRPVDLRGVVTRAVRLFAIQAKDKGVSLEVVEHPVAPLLGDETKLSWAVSNLLANAIRYTNAGGHVRVELAAADHRALVSVTDDGPGIRSEQQERIFERFTQNAGGEIGAAGLGLAIVRDIVQAHGGRIRLESALGRGTRFTLDLPATD
jgi:PAS domain S-box-containing protein